MTYTGLTGDELAGGSAQLLPVRGALIELWSGGTAGGTLLSTGVVGADGRYSLTATVPGTLWGTTPEALSGGGASGEVSVGNAGADAGGDTEGHDVFIRVYSQTPGGVTRPLRVGMNAPLVGGLETPGASYSFDSAVLTGISGEASLDLVVPDTGALSGAFSVLDAMGTAAGFYAAMPGSVARPTTAAYPTNNTIFNYSNDALHILDRHGMDWDVITRGYAYEVQRTHAITVGRGGLHAHDDNLRYSRSALGGLNGDDYHPASQLTRDEANELAWAEGWSVYFAIAAQQGDASAASAHRAGDLIYHETGPGGYGHQRWGIEDASIGAMPTGGGEDNEAAVARILWDLADDSGSAEAHDRVALGDTALFQTIVDHHVTSLSGLWSVLAADAADYNELTDLGAVFTAYGAGATPGPVESTAAGLRLAWSGPTGGDTSHGYANSLFNDFGVVFIDSDGRLLLDTGYLGDTGSYVLTAGEQALVEAEDGARWAVYARSVTTEQDLRGWFDGETYELISGGYLSEAVDFRATPEPGSLAFIGWGAALLSRRRRGA